MHSSCCTPGALQSYDEHCDDYTYASGTHQLNDYRNYYDTLEHLKKQYKQLEQSSIRAEYAECGQDQDPEV